MSTLPKKKSDFHIYFLKKYILEFIKLAFLNFWPSFNNQKHKKSLYMATPTPHTVASLSSVSLFSAKC